MPWYPIWKIPSNSIRRREIVHRAAKISIEASHVHPISQNEADRREKGRMNGVRVSHSEKKWSIFNRLI